MRLYINYGVPWWFSGEESACQYRRPGFNSWVEKILWKWKWQSTPVFLPGKSHAQKPVSPWGCKRVKYDFATKQLVDWKKTHNIKAPSFIQAPYGGLGFPSSSDSKKKSTCNVGNLDSIPGLGRSPGEENGYPLQYSVTQSVQSVVSHSLRPHHQLPEFPQAHVHWDGDAIQPSHPLSSPSPPAFSLSQHQGLFQWVSSSHQIAKVLEFQLQHQSFQWIFRTDFL